MEIQTGLSKRGLGPKGANWVKKGLHGAISALPLGCEVRRNWSWSAPKRPRDILERPQSAPKRPDFLGRISPRFSLKNRGLSSTCRKRGEAKGGRPLTIFFTHFLVTFSRFRSLIGNLFLVFGYLFA